MIEPIAIVLNLIAAIMWAIRAAIEWFSEDGDEDKGVAYMTLALCFLILINFIGG